MNRFGWPQVAMIAVIAINLFDELERHGEPKTGFHDFWTMLIGAIIEVIILQSGRIFLIGGSRTCLSLENW